MVALLLDGEGKIILVGIIGALALTAAAGLAGEWDVIDPASQYWV